MQIDNDEENDENKFNENTASSPEKHAKRGIKKEVQVNGSCDGGNTASLNRQLLKLEIKKENIKVEKNDNDDTEEHNDSV